MQGDYYAMIMQNKKNKQKLIGVLFWVATLSMVRNVINNYILGHSINVLSLVAIVHP
jgi:nicotinamide riboside transporter PnuC